MKSFVLVGGFSNTIEVFQLSLNINNFDDISLEFKESSKVGENPSYLEKNQHGIYSVHEVSTFNRKKSGGLSFLKLDETLKIRRVQEQFSSGQAPCHMVLNNEKGCVYIANYDSGQFAVAKLKKDGTLGSGMFIESYDVGSNVVPSRQGESHPHGVCHHGDFVYVIDLGGDRIYHYKHSTGADFNACQPEFTETPRGSGPRHMIFHPTHDLAFLITELSNEIITYKFNSCDGRLTKQSSYGFITEELNENDVVNYGAEIMIHPNGKFLYVSNRGNGALISYRILNCEGDLELVEVVRLDGTWPRHFNIHKSGKVLLCADQFKEEISVFYVDDQSGKLKKVNTVPCKNKPSCIIFNE